MTPARRLALILAALLLITAAGTAGYVFVADMTLIDALYMTVITISTVGFREVAPLDPASKLFTIGLIIVAVGTTIYLLTTLAQLILEGQLRGLLQRRTMQQRIDSLRDHVIVCGFGRFGRIVADELQRSGMPLVVVEGSPAKEPELAKSELPYVIGSATSDDVLVQAGVGRARAIVAGTGSDSDNVFISLAARELNPDLRIHARSESETGARRLKLAGAHQVISTYQIGGVRVATAILRPSVVDFLEIARPRIGPEVDLEEIRVDAGCGLVGQTIAEVEQRAPRVRVVALKSGVGTIELMPEDSMQISTGDHLVMIGERASLERLAQLATAG
jgi:voltage-gated potassium channel